MESDLEESGTEDLATVNWRRLGRCVDVTRLRYPQ